MLTKVILAATVVMLIASTAAEARRGYGYGYAGYGYSSNGRNNFGGAGHHVGETNGF